MGRLNRALAQRRRVAYWHYVYELNKSNDDTCIPVDSTENWSHGILQPPTQVCTSQSELIDGTRTIGINGWHTKSTGHVYKSSRAIDVRTCEGDKSSWIAETRSARVRVFDNQDKLLFDAVSGDKMLAPQVLQLCTNLVKHLNILARTSELEMQIAIGTLENSIIAQLSTIPDKYSQYPSWSSLQPGNSTAVYHVIKAIANIRQGPNRKFTGNLVDDLVGATFQLQ